MDFFVAPPAAQAVPRGDGDAAGRGRNPSSQPLNERYTFDTFVIGKSNELAAAAAHAAAESPGKTYNPLFIYGATGLGKTHLMQAIAHAVVRAAARTPGSLYVGAEQFINEVIESIHSRTMPEFRRRYRTDVDLFLVDDVHFLEGQGDDPGRVLPHLQCPVRGQQADRPDLGPAPQGDPGPRGPAGQPLRVGHGGRHRPARPGAPDRHPAEEAGAGPPGDDDPGRRAPVHRRARAVQRAGARGLHHQAAALRLAQAQGGLDRARPRGALGQDPAG